MPPLFPLLSPLSALTDIASSPACYPYTHTHKTTHSESSSLAFFSETAAAATAEQYILTEPTAVGEGRFLSVIFSSISLVHLSGFWERRREGRGRDAREPRREERKGRLIGLMSPDHR